MGDVRAPSPPQWAAAPLPDLVRSICAAVEDNALGRLDELLRSTGSECAAAVNAFGSNSATDECHTPLMIACCDGRHRIVRRLLEVAGIDHLLTTEDGETARDLAKAYGQVSCVTLLDSHHDHVGPAEPTQNVTVPEWAFLVEAGRKLGSQGSTALTSG